MTERAMMPLPTIAALALLAAACSPAAPNRTGPVEVTAPASAPPAATGEPEAREWRVGAYLSLSGAETQFGVNTQQGIDLAVDEVNARGGPAGRPMRVIYADDKSDPLEAVNRVRELIDRDKVIALLGEVASSRSKAGGIVANNRELPMITPSSTSAEVTQIGPFIFRACAIDDDQAKAAARYIVQSESKKRLAMLFASDDLYSKRLAKVFHDEATRLGAQVVVQQSFAKTETRFTTYLQAIGAQKPDKVYAPLYYTQMIPVAIQAKAAGFAPDVFMGSDSWDSEELLRSASVELEGAIFTDHWVIDAPSDTSHSFVAAFQQRYHRAPSSLEALGYDAARLLADAIGRARGGTPDAIREALQATRNLPAVTGPISMNGDRNPDKPIFLVRVTGGRFTYAASVTLSGGTTSP